MLAAFALLSARALWQGYDALDRGDAAMTAGDASEAIVWWRRAARWYVPLAPHVDRAYERLEKLAAQAEEQGDTALSLSAWRGVRNSIRATRSFYTPHEDRVDRADQKISELMAKLDTTPVALESRQAFHYELLKRDSMPSVGWSVVALLGLALWVASGFAFAVRGLDDADRLRKKAAAYSGLGIVLGLLIWLTGLALA